MSQLQSEIEQRLQTLRANGNHHFKPLRYHHAETLAQKASVAREPVQAALHKKTLALLESYQQDLDANEAASCRLPKRSATPALLNELHEKLNHRHRRHGGNNCGKNGTPPPESISDHLLEKEDATLAAAGFTTISHQQPMELQAYIEYRASKKQFETDKLVDAIVGADPETLGPLNPQLLLIRSLESMRELSPHYLSRFVGYIDTLIRLEGEE